MSTWTPGPWQATWINDDVIGCEPLHEVASASATYDRGISVRVAGAFDIDDACYSGIGSAAANAALIALAPEMAVAIMAYRDANENCGCDALYGDCIYCEDCRRAAIADDPSASHPYELFRYKHGVASKKLYELAEKLRKIGAGE